eukprot:TRINITY_DN1644_c1_g1_i2.p1 TRINITY_DN1644_c1_g1~~TRINITY_DN1644_c1_g1_i2.p1  ORF type:complete len:196 (-),score=-25.93 TRINITY_DN1644_c1_g1_i2:106-693(-)
MNHQKVANSSYSILWHSYIIINMTLTIIISVILIILSSLIQNEQKHINRVQQIQLEFCCYETMIKFATVTLSQCKNQKNPTQICKKSNIEICICCQNNILFKCIQIGWAIDNMMKTCGSKFQTARSLDLSNSCCSKNQIIIIGSISYKQHLLKNLNFQQSQQAAFASSQYNPHNQVVKYFFDLYIIVYKVNCLQY